MRDACPVGLSPSRHASNTIADPKLPYEDNSFDVITNAVSVDYLAKPMEVFKEMHRVLKPGGQAIMSFSNRCFPTKGAPHSSDSALSSDRKSAVDSSADSTLRAL